MYVICMKNRTTLQLRKEIREQLRKCKKYPRETYEDTLKRLIKKELRK